MIGTVPGPPPSLSQNSAAIFARALESGQSSHTTWALNALLATTSIPTLPEHLPANTTAESVSGWRPFLLRHCPELVLALLRHVRGCEWASMPAEQARVLHLLLRLHRARILQVSTMRTLTLSFSKNLFTVLFIYNKH